MAGAKAASGTADGRRGQETTHAGPPTQRNFLLDFDTLLKVMQLDYIDCQRFLSSGYTEFMGKLYTMNPAMFQSPVYCDRELTQMALHYLSWFQDPGVRLVAGPGAAWHRLSSMGLQRLEDELWVTKAEAGAPLSVGTRIATINGMTLGEIRPEVERTLCTTAEPADPEREDWGLVVDFAKKVGVREGSGPDLRTVRLISGSSDVAARERREKGIPEPQALGSSEALLPAASLEEGGGGVCLIRLRRPGDPSFAGLAERIAGEAADAGAVVIDARGCAGGGQADIYPLVPLVLGPGGHARPEELFGPAGIVMNYSRHNVEAKLADLAELRKRMAGESGDRSASPDGASPAELGELDALEAELRERRGAGLVRDDTDYYPDMVFSSTAGKGSSRRVALLVDRDTSDAAEWLVRAARSAGHASVVGRATRGSLDNTCPRFVRLDADFGIVVPTAKYRAAADGQPTLGRGIVPDVHLVWSPVQLEHDAELDEACALVKRR